MNIPQRTKGISILYRSTSPRVHELLFLAPCPLTVAMPVFTEHSSSSRNLRVLPSFASPLPRLSPPFEPQNGVDEKYEVVIVGVCCTTPIYTNTRFSPATL
jgi:hypothetical protein